jgi:hypothetical protein
MNQPLYSTFSQQNGRRGKQRTKITKISTGFLVGNLFPDLGYDEAASAERLAKLTHDALTVAFPGADVAVSVQFATGQIPKPLETMATSAEDDWIEAELACERIDAIAMECYESYDWWVVAHAQG